MFFDGQSSRRVCRPSGAFVLLIDRRPTDESVGFFRTSLRDKDTIVENGAKSSLLLSSPSWTMDLRRETTPLEMVPKYHSRKVNDTF